MDLIIRTAGVTDLSAAAVTSASDMTALTAPDELPQLVLGTTEPMTVKFVSAAGTFEAWSDDPSYSVMATLGEVTADGTDSYAEAALDTVISDGKGGDLNLDTTKLNDAIGLAFQRNRRAATVQLVMQITVTDPTGDRRTYAMIPVTVWGKVSTYTPDAANNPPALQAVLATRDGALASPTNLFLKAQTIGDATAQLQLNGNGSVAYLGAQGVKTNEYDGFYLITPTITDNVGRGFDVKVTYAGNPSSIGATGHNCFFYTTGSHVAPHVFNYQSWLYHQGTYRLPIGNGYWAFLDNSAGSGAWTQGCGFYFGGISGSIDDHWAFYDVGGSPTRHSGKVYIGEAVIPGVQLPNTQIYVTRAHGVIAGGLSSPTATFRSTNTAAVGVGGAIALGGESGAGTTPYSFAFILGAKEQAGATYNGYLAFYTTDTGSNNSEKARITSAGNLLVGATTDIAGSNGLKVAGARVNFSALPTSAAGLVAGDLWNDGGSVKIVL